MFSELLGAGKVVVVPLTQAQLACEMAIVDVLPQLLTTEEVDVAEFADAVGLCHMLISGCLAAVDWQLQRKGTMSLQARVPFNNTLQLPNPHLRLPNVVFEAMLRSSYTAFDAEVLALESLTTCSMGCGNCL